jgi:hypothetical protein
VRTGREKKRSVLTKTQYLASKKSEGLPRSTCELDAASHISSIRHASARSETHATEDIPLSLHRPGALMIRAIGGGCQRRWCVRSRPSFKICEKGIGLLCNLVKFQHRDQFGHGTFAKALITFEGWYVAGPSFHYIQASFGRVLQGPKTQCLKGVTPNPMSRLVPFA